VKPFIWHSKNPLFFWYPRCYKPPPRTEKPVRKPMSLKIRFSRGGTKKRPYYRLVVTNSRSPRDSKYIEKLGAYNPLLAKDDANRVSVKEDRIKHWLGIGALPSETAARFLRT